MRISFRQGLVRVPANFLSLASNKVSLVIPPNATLIATLADGHSDYLLTERQSISNAWTGPFTAGHNYWLYWDINVASGLKTFGHTTLEPVEGANPPVNPAVDQHWFDLTTTTMKVWTGSSWARKVRVFAAKLTGGSIFVSVGIASPSYVGTQVGFLSSIPVHAGALVFDDVNGKPIKKADGTFFTSEDIVVTGIASSTQVKFNSIVIEAVAAGNIPAFSLVNFTDFDTVDIATNLNIGSSVYGMCEAGATNGNVLQIVLEGLIENENWDWTSAGVNAPVYVSTLGTLTTTAPPNPTVVATVVGPHSILLRPSTTTLDAVNAPMTTSGLGLGIVSVPPVSAQSPVLVGDNDPRITAVNPHIANAAVHLTTAQNTFLDSLTANSASIDQLLTVSHTLNSNWEYKTLSGTANQITVTPSTGTFTLSLPQNIATTSNVTFGRVTASAHIDSPNVLTDGSTINWDLTGGTFGMLILTGNHTLANPTNLVSGMHVTLMVTQDGVGSHTLSYGTKYLFAGGAAPVVAPGANAVSIITFVSDGTNLYEVSRSLNVS